MAQHLDNAPRWKTALTKAQPRFEEIARANRLEWAQESIFAFQLIAKSDYLQKTDPMTIRDAVINVATVGLTLNPAHKLAYLVPRDGMCCLDISYMGLLRIATDSGSVRHAAVELVYSCDHFKWKGKHALPDHEFDPFAEDRGEFRGAYITAKLADGDWLCDHMSAAEVYKIRECSKAYKDRDGRVRQNSVWVVWFEEMVKKSLVKRASKLWPKSDRMREAADILDRHEGLEDAFNSARNITPDQDDNRPAGNSGPISDEQEMELTALLEEQDSITRQGFLLKLRKFIPNNRAPESIADIPACIFHEAKQIAEEAR